ncbi:extracellular solute-binding protein [Orbaceae bacterium ESL0727]|nr:extracellular solute-binding protein [Orbaceae bacterium ESL0727]
MIERIKQIATLFLLSACGLTLLVAPLYANETVHSNKPTEKAETAIEESAIKESAIEKTDVEPAPHQLASQVDLVNMPSEKIYHQTIFSLLGDPKYSENFAHFAYVDPNAPKGGTIRLAEVGNFDNFNRYASRGAPEINSASIYETLFTNSADDISTYYPLIATSITYSDRYQWAEVTLNPAAHFHDGVPITAADVEFSFTKFMTEGVSQYRVYNAGITVKAIAPYLVRIELPTGNREKLLAFVGDMTVLPKHFWQDHNLSEPLTTPPLGSAAYYINDYKLGQYVVYQRDPHYWGANLPVNKGLYNFDQKRIDYYMDSSVALEAFKAGEYDFRAESQPKNWYTQYQGNYFDHGYIIKQEDEVKIATQTQWLAINLQKPIFQDSRVRQALTLAFDFDWLNRAFYYNSYKRPRSFFENTLYAATGKPSKQEIALLEPFRKIIPATVFDDAYNLPASDASGFNRHNLLIAAQLLKESGWIVKNGKLINSVTGEPFKFELLTYMGADIKYAIPYQQNLARLGIDMTISAFDYAQITRRLRERDYDMMPRVYMAVNHPTSDLMILWGSQYLDSSWNASGLHNEAIDSLIEQIAKHNNDQSSLIPLGRALDRVLTNEYAMIPMWYPHYTYYAYWNKFGKPTISPIYNIGVASWWYDAKKAATLPKNQEY